MQEFDGGGEQAQIVAGKAQGFAAEQHQQRAQAFATGGDNIVADLLYQGDARHQLGADDAVDSGKIVRHHAIESLGLHRLHLLLMGCAACYGAG